MTTNARRLAIDAIVRIDKGAYANVLLPKMLKTTNLERRDKNFVTELVYGSTRRKRAHDYVVDKFLLRCPPPEVRAALRVGTHQLLELATPAHAAVSATVAATPKAFQGLVNAVLRKVAEANEAGIEYPNKAVALSYPDWILELLCRDLGTKTALEVLSAMNLAAQTTYRQDGYVQDPSSTAVAALLPVKQGDLVLDLCAAPGGKATAIAARGALVVASDVNFRRVALLQKNLTDLQTPATDLSVRVVVADGTKPPFTNESFAVVLVDAPCSGLATLRRRPDARWRIQKDNIDALIKLQRRLLSGAATLVKPGGYLAYSVCTLTKAETSGVVQTAAAKLHSLSFALQQSNMALPTTTEDGMFSAIWRRRGTELSI